MASPLCLRTTTPLAFTAKRPCLRTGVPGQQGPLAIRSARRQRLAHVTHATADSEDIGTAGVAAVGLGALANPVVLLSDYVLFKTGRGLPEGPGGIYGAAEGVSYLVVLGVVGWSLYTKILQKGSLPGITG